MAETNGERWDLEKVKSYDDSWWLKYLEAYSVFDTEGIKAQKDWLIERVQELEEAFDELEEQAEKDRKHYYESDVIKANESLNMQIVEMENQLDKIKSLVNSEKAAHAVKFELRMMFKGDEE